MGQKIHPNGFRVGITRGWDSRWYAGKSEFGALVVEDAKIREFVRKRLRLAGVARIEVERTGDEVRLLLSVARPGIVIGRKHAEIDRLRDEVQRLTGKRVVVNVREVSNPDANAQLLAEGVAAQLLKRASFRRAMRRAMETARSAGALGVRIACGGRLDYGEATAKTTYGAIGVKIWLYKGRIKKETGRAADAKAR
jgi:small subunit ribosomal protein S3